MVAKMEAEEGEAKGGYGERMHNTFNESTVVPVAK